MRKQNRPTGLDGETVKNPVAKFAHHFNKAVVYTDKRQYRRKAKHAGQEPFSITIPVVIEKGLVARWPACDRGALSRINSVFSKQSAHLSIN